MLNKLFFNSSRKFSSVKSSKDTVLITGSCGFIGKNLVEKLNPFYNIIGVDYNDKLLDQVENYKTYKFDVNNLNSDYNILRGNNVDQFWADVSKFIKNNNSDLKGIIHLANYYDFTNKFNEFYGNQSHFIKFIEKHQKYFNNVPILFASSLSTLCANKSKLDQNSEYSESKLPYIQSKIQLEKEMYNYSMKKNVNVTSLLLSGVYSDHCELYLMYKFIEQIRLKTIYGHFFSGNMNNHQSYIHIDDLVSNIHQYLLNPSSNKFTRLLLGKSITYKKLFESIDPRHKIITVPTKLASKFLKINQKFNKNYFFKDWMLEFADKNYELNSNEFQMEHNISKDINQMLKKSKQNEKKMDWDE